MKPPQVFVVWTQTSGIGNKIRWPHKVVDTRTQQIVDEYHSKRAAQMACTACNKALVTSESDSE